MAEENKTDAKPPASDKTDTKQPQPKPGVIPIQDVDKAEIKKLLNKSEISLVLDTYDDIFSDFDPRPYAERSLSVDFLNEAQRASRDKKTGLELHFLIPKAVRNAAQEDKIKQRLKEHFKRHYKQLEKERSKYTKQSLIMIAIGVVIGLVDALTLSTPSTFSLSTVLTTAVGLILTPASWFTIWTGFDRLVFRPEDKEAEVTFNKKMSGANFVFTPY